MIHLFKTKRRQKEIDRLVATAYCEGFQQGFEAGKEETILTKLTPNEIRAACGLGPIEVGLEKGEK